VRWIEACFWLCTSAVAYTYCVYPIILLLVAKLWRRTPRLAPFEGSVSIVVSAHNEAHQIAKRRDELVSLLDASHVTGQVIVVSDGSDDGTAAAAAQDADERVRVIALEQNVGKAQALSTACASATGDVIVFADARQRWAPDAMSRLLENLADPRVGGVSGDLCLEEAPGVVAGVGLYWRYEKALRKLEGQIHSTVGATGAISSVRRSLFRPIPPRTILDDVYWPLQVVMQGYRVIHDDRAQAFDRLPSNAKDEFRRKVRTLSGNFQLMARMPAVLLPWKNPIWVQFISHKLLRLAVPWLLIGMLATSGSLSASGYRFAFAAQVLGYLMALLGMHPAVASRVRLVSVGSSFVVLNAAAWVGFWVWIFGRSGKSWRKTAYGDHPADAAKPWPVPAPRETA
jgi:poly-beta-1,6-N-acetyl-D-glucosamine synthase